MVDPVDLVEKSLHIRWLGLWLVGVLIVILFAIKYLSIYIRNVRVVLGLPGPFAWPIIGNAHWIINSRKLVQGSVDCPKLYGPVIRAWIAVFPVVVIFDPKYIQAILSNSKHVEKTRLYKMMHNFLGEGLITSEGYRWKIHRKLMQPNFRINVLEEFVGVFSKGAERLADNLSNQMQCSSSDINVTGLINKTVFSILSEAILGIAIESSKSKKFVEESPYRQGSTELLYRILRPWLLFPTIYQITETAKKEIHQKNALIEFTIKTIEERKKLREKNDFESTCYLDYLIDLSDEHADFTLNDCAQEACTLMLAGQDSVGAALAFALHVMATHPEIQEKVFAELYSIFGDSDRPANLDDLREMVYLDKCIKETLRIYPSVPIILRTLGENVALGNVTLPKGCEVMFVPYATHRLEEIYPNPDVFDPERFCPEAISARNPYSYLPFSAGPRNCIGYKFAELEMKTVLSTVLRKFRLRTVSGKENLILTYRITLRASGGIWVKFESRSKGKKSPYDERQL